MYDAFGTACASTLAVSDDDKGVAFVVVTHASSSAMSLPTGWAGLGCEDLAIRCGATYQVELPAW